MNNGFRTMPVLLRILWIFLLIGVFLALWNIAYIYKGGHYFMGVKFAELYALDIYFIQQIALPLILVVAMFKRFWWTWIYAMFFFTIAIVNYFLLFQNTNEIISDLMSQLKELPEGLPEEMVPSMFKMAFYISNGFMITLDISIIILFVLKRKYFLNSISVENSN